MSIFHLLTVLSSIVVGFVHPAIAIFAQKTETPHVLASEIKRLPTVTPIFTLTPTPTKLQLVSAISTSQNILIDCIGPDGKHLHITQKACDDFNGAWHSSHLSPTSTSPYGQAKQVGTHTYELQVAPDGSMTNVQDLLAALNAYRQKNGVGSVVWDSMLSNYAQNRANLYASKGSLDEHAGFTDFIHNQDGFTKLGFNHLGENAAYAGPLTGTHLIEWVYAADAEHNKNQLNPDWTSVGMGISGIASDIVFGGSPR